MRHKIIPSHFGQDKPKRTTSPEIWIGFETEHYSVAYRYKFKSLKSINRASLNIVPNERSLAMYNG